MKISSPKAINWTLKQYGYRNGTEHDYLSHAMQPFLVALLFLLQTVVLPHNIFGGQFLAA
jgi:hypothetical protein